MKKDTNPTVARMPRELSISGTRITLYQILDYLKANQPTETIRQHFRLTIKQMSDVMNYIKCNRQEVDEEYQRIVKQAEENRAYWEERNKQRFDKIAKLPRKPEHRALWAKLDAKKAELMGSLFSR